MAAPKNIAGYPQPSGAKRECVRDHVGPKSYTQITVATPPTGGDQITAKSFGLSFFDHVAGGLSDDGQYFVVATMAVGAAGEVSSAKLIWIIAHTGAEVTGAVDLSARTVRLRAIGG